MTKIIIINDDKSQVLRRVDVESNKINVNSIHLNADVCNENLFIFLNGLYDIKRLTPTSVWFKINGKNNIQAAFTNLLKQNLLTGNFLAKVVNYFTQINQKDLIVNTYENKLSTSVSALGLFGYNSGDESKSDEDSFEIIPSDRDNQGEKQAELFDFENSWNIMKGP